MSKCDNCPTCITIFSGFRAGALPFVVVARCHRALIGRGVVSRCPIQALMSVSWMPEGAFIEDGLKVSLKKTEKGYIVKYEGVY